MLDELAPYSDEYVPTGHSMHVELVLAAVDVEYVPGEHDVHSIPPVVLKYVPEGQGCLSTPTPPGQMYPAGQLDPEDELDPIGQ